MQDDVSIQTPSLEKGETIILEFEPIKKVNLREIVGITLVACLFEIILLTVSLLLFAVTVILLVIVLLFWMRARYTKNSKFWITNMKIISTTGAAGFPKTPILFKDIALVNVLTQRITNTAILVILKKDSKAYKTLGTNGKIKFADVSNNDGFIRFLEIGVAQKAKETILSQI